MPAGAEVDCRIDFLEQQIRDLEQHLRNECSSSVKLRVQLTQQAAELEQAVSQLKQQLNQAVNAYRVQRQRADQLQLAIGSGRVQNQREVALREQIQRQAQQIREQQAAFSATTTRLFEQRRNAQKNQEQLQMKVELLEMRLQDEDVSLEEERVPLHGQATEVIERWTCSSILATKNRETQLSNPTRTTPPKTMSIDKTTNQVLSQRLSVQLREFELERAQLLEQASDAAIARQGISLQNPRNREAALTCPISRELLVDPVVTECCGKTFSSQALTRALDRRSSCPLCDEDERVQDIVPASSPPPRAGDDTEVDKVSDVQAGRSLGSSQRTEESGLRQSRHRERRIQRLFRRRSSRSIPLSALPASDSETFPSAASSADESAESRRQTRSSARRRQQSSGENDTSTGPLNAVATWLARHGHPGSRRRITRHRQPSTALYLLRSQGELEQFPDDSDSD
ncbi:hypothetical protein PHYPSEUDO_005065 [Phytophthora pseudosyringae]|uniref:SP-RING-type domain-containing protein n=1 Tax=Phytophthora pseudosyringae TaxID=221518 RepID=A0A8T1VLX3_9STRA|nr:hypothetical protein PHYPSEUDO_005065 [Phytophthora pseudosyringae]